MKKITLLLLSLLCGFVGYSQFPENFEAVTVSVPNVFPAGWLVTDNGVGTVNNWEIKNEKMDRPKQYRKIFNRNSR